MAEMTGELSHWMYEKISIGNVVIPGPDRKRAI
jgi:hypothetical protein